MTIQKTAITVGPISDALNGGKQVELRQTIRRGYDDSNNLSDALFSGLRASFDETRVTWRQVPEDATPEIVKEELAKYPDACLYRILSHKLIMNDGQDRLYKNGFVGQNADKAFADFKARTGLKSTQWDDACRAAFLKIVAEAQTVKYGEGATDGKPGDPVLYNGKIQYKVIAFSKTAKADIDLRNEAAVEEGVVLAQRNVAEAVVTQ
jgi:hypothetical protein